MPARKQTSLDKIVAAIRSDPKKAGILTVLLVVLAVSFARMSNGKPGPQQAVAGASNNAPAGARTAQRTAAQASLNDWKNGPIPPLGRNLFAVKFEHFPRDGTRSEATVPHGDGFWDQVAKSMSAQADQRTKRQVLIENLQRQAAQ